MSDQAPHKVTQEELQHKFSAEDAYFAKLERERLQAAQARASKLHCPKDPSCVMEPENFHGIVIDRCPHGVWLDNHELEELVRNLTQVKKEEGGFLQSLIESLRPA